MFDPDTKPLPSVMKVYLLKASCFCSALCYVGVECSIASSSALTQGQRWRTKWTRHSVSLSPCPKAPRSVTCTSARVPLLVGDVPYTWKKCSYRDYFVIGQNANATFCTVNFFFKDFPTAFMYFLLSYLHWRQLKAFYFLPFKTCLRSFRFRWIWFIDPCVNYLLQLLS